MRSISPIMNFWARVIPKLPVPFVFAMYMSHGSCALLTMKSTPWVCLSLPCSIEYLTEAKLERGGFQKHPGPWAGYELSTWRVPFPTPPLTFRQRSSSTSRTVQLPREP